MDMNVPNNCGSVEARRRRHATRKGVS